MLGFAVIALAACARAPSRPVAFVPTQDPVTRLVSAEPEMILTAGATALREMGFDIAPPNASINWIYSNPIVIQSTWRGGAIADRILCGIGTAVGSDRNRVNQLANTIPVELSLGWEVEILPSATATRILFGAQGRRSGFGFLTPPTMSCTLTHEFVDELFAALQTQLRGTP